MYYTYLPSKYNIKSTDGLIQVLHTIKPNNGILASLGVENLFTNVPVNEAIDIIINDICPVSWGCRIYRLNL